MVERFVAGANIVVAHNAPFDRPFCEKLSAVFRGKPWACSLREPDWKALGTTSARLGDLLAGMGLFHDGHRALADCHALLEVLAAPAAGGSRTAWDLLLSSARRRTIRVEAVDAPFVSRRALKERGYRWFPGNGDRKRCWETEISEAMVKEELKYLSDEVMTGNSRILTTPITARERHRG